MVTLVLAGCSSQEPTPAAVPTPTKKVATPTDTPQVVLVETSLQTSTPAREFVQVCSPLAGVKMEQLNGMIVNPYHPPKLGSDDPHQGLDLAKLSGPYGIALAGMTVNAVLSGKVAGAAVDRFPYGNMVMIETPLDDSLYDAVPDLILPTPLPERLPQGALTCPELTANPGASDEPRSLYILYAHMQNPVNARPGDLISCGQEIGIVGDSGNALNPHLHIEVRVGPSGQIFPSMAHYDPSADSTEMEAYCTWRVSGVYQTINPACLWGECSP